MNPRGATAWVTLEPCAHHGRTPPCVEALARAGIARVVAPCPDPNPLAAGGMAMLREAGIRAEFVACPEAERLSAPFRKLATTGLPWVIVKWAQTIDGKIAARTGDSKWISGEASRRLVHRIRGRVDAILTGIGTVATDDPLLTARRVPIRREARRCVIDPELAITDAAALLNDGGEPPVTLFTTADSMQSRSSRVDVLRGRGIEVIPHGAGSEVDVQAVLKHLAKHGPATNVLVEAGPGLISRLLDQQLADELLVFIGGKVIGDALAPSAVHGRVIEAIADAEQWSLRRAARLGPDAVLTYGRA